MANWTLAEIRLKTRELSGRLSADELSNGEVLNYINRYYQYEFPADLKLNRNYTLHEFTTTANTRDYTFPTAFTNFVPPATIDRQEIDFYQNPADFELDNPQNVARFTQWTGDGSTVAFSNTYTNNIPIQAGSVVVDDTVEVFTDDGAGTLTGDQGASGTVDYTTGAISVTFTTAPTDGQSIYVSFIQYRAGQPRAVLMFNNKFRFFPIPDRAYRFQIQAWSLTTVVKSDGSTAVLFSDADDKPARDEWGFLIALGSARRIASSYGDTAKTEELKMLYEEQVGLVMTRTLIDLESTRSKPYF